MTRVIHNMVQGSHSPEWMSFRLSHFGSSEAAAMLSLSKTTTRSELLRMKHTGTPKEFSDWVQTNILDHGHAVEALTRPLIEADIGEDLYPCTCSLGDISASCDGLTLDETTAWECKQFAAGIFAQVQAGEVPPEHMPQCQQILMVTGADRLIFTVSDGTRERLASVKVFPDEHWFTRLRDGWAQFKKDLADYIPLVAAPVVVASAMETLPAVSVRVDGSLSCVNNLDRFGTALRAFVARIPAQPTTDQEFADCDAASKALKTAEDALDAAEANALAGVASVEEMRRLVADCKAIARTARLASEKVVQRRKDEIRTDIIAKARNAYAAHLSALNAELTPVSLVLSQPDFAGAAKNKRTLATLQDAVDGELAASKIAADAAARAMREKLSWFRESVGDFQFLFADLSALAQKPADDFRLAVQARIEAHQAADAARKAQAERVMSEAMAKASATPAPAPAPTASVTPIRSAADEPAALNLGDVCAWLGVSLTAADIANRFGIEPAARVKAATRYTLSQAEAIRAALVAHLTNLQPLRAAA